MKNILLSAALMAALSAAAGERKVPSLFTTQGGTTVSAFGNLDVGYGNGTFKDTATSSGGDIMFRFEVGAKILLPARSENKTWMISASGAYTLYDISPGEHSLNFALFTLPVSIGQYGEGGRHGRGFFWQIGTNINYVHKVTDNTKVVTKAFTTVYPEPFISLGVSTPYILLRGREEVGNKRSLFGPYFSYIPGNVAKAPNSLSGWTFGLRWTAIFSKGD